MKLRTLPPLLLLCLPIPLIACLGGPASDEEAQGAPSQDESSLTPTPVSRYGRLKVCGNRICDQSGNPVQLRGMSYFWSNTGWGGEKFYNASSVNNLANTWNATVVRAAVGVEGSGGYLESAAAAAANTARAKALVDAAIAAGVYVIVDWHYSSNGIYQSQAQAFFQTMAQAYASSPNIIWEPFNEPTSNSWASLKSYHQAIISTIRAAGSQNLVVVGSPTWSQDVDVASADPITTDANVAYTLHFYAGTHGQSLRDKANTALSRGVAIFTTEWGTCDASGNNTFNPTESRNWTNWMDSNKISSCNWSLNDKAETASALVGGASTTGPWPDSQLTQSGAWVKPYVVAGYSPGPVTNYTLTVAKAGTGSGTVTSSPSGVSCGNTCSANFASGTSVTLTASAASGSTFAGWSGACTGTGACTVSMTAARSVTATFNGSSTTYALTVAKAGTGSGTVTSSPSGVSCGNTCSASFASGTSVTLTASAASGSTFAGWSGACTGTGACTVSMTAARSVTATFNGSATTYALTVAKAGTGSGTVTSSPSGVSCGNTCSANFASGTSVTLTASAASGSTFAGWSGACTGTGACTVSMTAARSVTATFNGSGGGGTCRVVYSVPNQWSGGFQAGISIQNTGSTAWSSWTLTFKFGGDQRIASLWNGSFSQSGAAVTVKNLSYNGSVAPGATYSAVGLTGTYGSSNAAPTGFTVNGVACN